MECDGRRRFGIGELLRDRFKGAARGVKSLSLLCMGNVARDFDTFWPVEFRNN